MSYLRRNRVECFILVALLLVESISLCIWAHERGFITYRQDFGETLVAFDQARKLPQTASRFGLLHVELTSEGKELVYTHNVNLGTIYFLFLRLLNVTSLRAQTAAVLPVFILSLLVAYFSVKAASESVPIAQCFLGLMVLDFCNVGAFAFNALRAWHYLGLFMCIYGAHLLQTRQRKAVISLVFLVLGAMVSFCCGYDFFVISAWVTLIFSVVFSQGRARFVNAVWIVFAFAVPFFLRQLEVIYWMGYRTWYVDFCMTFAIKVPFASRLVRIPGIDEINLIYERAGLYRPPALPTSSWAGIWQTLVPLTELSAIPNYGLMGCLLVALAAITAVFVALRQGWSSAGIRSFGLITVYFIGASLGLLAFAPFSFHVYIKHNFPLAGALIHLAEATWIVHFYRWATAAASMRLRIKQVLCYSMALLIIANAIVVQLRNSRHSKELDFGWLALLPSPTTTPNPTRPTALFAAMAPPESRSVLGLDGRAKIVSPDLAPWILAKECGLLAEDPLVSVSSPTQEQSTLIYAPGDGWCNMDAREPDLSNRDFLLSLSEHLYESLRREPEDISVVPYIITGKPVPLHPKDILHMEFFLPDLPNDRYSDYKPELELVTSDGRRFIFLNLLDSIIEKQKGGAVSMLYNAKFRTLDVYFALPRQLIHGTDEKVRMRVTLRSKERVKTSDFVDVSYTFSAARCSVVPRLPEPTTYHLLEAFRRLPILKLSTVGVGYVELGMHSIK